MARRTRRIAEPTTKAKAEKLLKELLKRYEDAEKPRTLGELDEQNPDLGLQLSILKRNSKEFYGVTIAKLLKERGILQAHATKRPASAAAAESKPPEGSRAEQLEDACRLVEELGEKLCDILPARDKPKEFSDLVEMFPEWEGRIANAKKLRVIGKAKLRDLGILYSPRCYAIDAMDSGKLLGYFPDSLKTTSISPEESAKVLSPWIRQVDLANDVELRHVVTGLWVEGACEFHPGERYDIRVDSGGDSGSGIEVLTEHPVHLAADYAPSLLWDTVSESPSELSREVGAKVISVSECEGRTFALFEVDFLAQLSADVLVSLLRRRGIVTDTDLAGGMGWRLRLWKMRREESAA